MAVSRRGFMTSAMTGSALAAVSSTGVLSGALQPGTRGEPAR